MIVGEETEGGEEGVKEKRGRREVVIRRKLRGKE